MLFNGAFLTQGVMERRKRREAVIWKAKNKLENDTTFDLMDTCSGAVQLAYRLRGESKFKTWW